MNDSKVTIETQKNWRATPRSRASKPSDQLAKNNVAPVGNGSSNYNEVFAGTILAEDTQRPLPSLGLTAVANDVMTDVIKGFFADRPVRVHPALGHHPQQMDTVEPYKPVGVSALQEGVKGTDRPRGSIVQNLVPYAPHMEFGTQPRLTHIEPLCKWARQKLRERDNVRRDAKEPPLWQLENLARRAKHSITKVSTKDRISLHAALTKLPGIVERSSKRELKRSR